MSNRTISMLLLVAGTLATAIFIFGGFWYLGVIEINSVRVMTDAEARIIVGVMMGISSIPAVGCSILSDYIKSLED